MTIYYILKNGTPVPTNNHLKWARWFENADNRIIKQSQISPFVKVSTVFLGLDHNFTGGRPLLYETLVFGGLCDGEMRRYHTAEDAIAGHADMVELAEAMEKTLLGNTARLKAAFVNFWGAIKSNTILGRFFKAEGVLNIRAVKNILKRKVK